MDSEHEHAGKFKGMAIILEEWGYVYVKKMKAQCGKKFSDCGPGAVDFCCHQTLFNQPDFVNVKSLLETEVKENGFQVLFLLKFHCELNLIEQCWGYAKRIYRLRPPSSNEADLRKNVVECLNEVPLITI